MSLSLPISHHLLLDQLGDRCEDRRRKGQIEESIGSTFTTTSTSTSSLQIGHRGGQSGKVRRLVVRALHVDILPLEVLKELPLILRIEANVGRDAGEEVRHGERRPGVANEDGLPGNEVITEDGPK